MDITFIVDSSGSIGRTDWARLKRFLMSLTSKLDVSSANTHVSAISFSTEAKVAFLFNSLQTTDEVNKQFDGFLWQRKYTYIDRGLQLADSDLFVELFGMRPRVAKVCKNEKKNCLRFDIN